MPGIRGEEDEQPARRRAVDGFFELELGSCGVVGWAGSYRVV